MLEVFQIYDSTTEDLRIVLKELDGAVGSTRYSENTPEVALHARKVVMRIKNTL